MISGCHVSPCLFLLAVVAVDGYQPAENKKEIIRNMILDINLNHNVPGGKRLVIDQMDRNKLNALTNHEIYRKLLNVAFRDLWVLSYNKTGQGVAQGDGKIDGK